MKSVKISLHRKVFKNLVVFCKKNHKPLRTAIRHAQDFYILFYGQVTFEKVTAPITKQKFTKPKIQIQHVPVNEFFLNNESGFSKSILIEMAILIFIQNLNQDEALIKALARPLKNTKLYEA